METNNETHTHTCPHCGASMSKYWHRLSKGLVITLIEFKQAVLQKRENKIHVPKDVSLTKNQYNNFQKLRYHALVAKARTASGAHESGFWVLTRRGNQFLNGEIAIPEKVQTFRNKITDKSEKRVLISEVLKGEQKVWDEKPDFLESAPDSDIEGGNDKDF